MAGRRGEAVRGEGGGERLGAAHEVVRLDRGEAACGDLGEGAFEVGLQCGVDREQLNGCLDRHGSRSFVVVDDGSGGQARRESR